MAAIAALKAQIGSVEQAVIDTLFALYDAQFSAILANPAGVTDGSVALDRADVAAILARLAEAA